MKQHRKKGLVAALGATIAAGALALSGAVMANAAPTVLPTDTEGSLTITKYEMPDTVPGDEATGIENPSQTGKGINGVTFSVCRVGTGDAGTDFTPINLATNAGWSAAQAATLSFDQDGSHPVVKEGSTTYACDTPVVKTTAGETGDVPNGIAEFKNLPIGLYLVEETGTPAGVTASMPFLVTIPITNAATTVGGAAPGTTWVYDVFVYPKNSVVKIDKTIDDAAPYGKTSATPNSQHVAFTITADVPRIPGDTADEWIQPTSYVIEDTVSNEFGEITLGPIVTVGSTALGPAGESCLTEDNPDYSEVSKNGYAISGKFTITFCEPGLKALQAAAAESVATDRQVTVGFTVAVPLDASGTLTNEATVTINGDTASKITSDAVETKWGPLTFRKKGQGDTDKDGLNGAKFQLFLTEEDARAATSGNLRTDPIASEKVDDDNGMVTFTGIRYSDWANNATASPGTVVKQGDDSLKCEPNPDYIIYWLTETKSPDGYELLAEPVPVVLDSGTLKQVAFPIKYEEDDTWTEDSVGEGCGFATDSTALNDITNVQKNAGFKLPLTGGMGTLFLMVAGGALLAVVLLVARRRRAQDA